MDALYTINNRYQVLQKLGEGGMGVVFLAYDRLNKKKVAIKKLHDTTTDMSDTREANEKISLAHEFQILAALKHPNIINVIDFGFANDSSPYFTMDYLEESPNIIGYGQSQTFSARIDLILQMLLALAYLHRNGIVHRDLKPDNALVNIEGKVQLLDFGIAVDNRYSIEKTDDNTVSGTLAYMAPEILEGESATPASDLYAVGIMAYQLLANKYPFSLENITKLITDVIHTMPDISFLQSTIEQQLWNEQNNILPSSLDDQEGYELGDGLKTVAYDRNTPPPSTPLNTMQMDDFNPLLESEDSEEAQKPSQNAIYFSDNHDVPLTTQTNELVNADYVFEVVAIINNLVMKNPHVRYQNATAVIEALCKALDRPLPDDVAIRESYLQGASFVGREAELNQIKTAIGDMLNESGSAWLIGGESGVGKSRFLDEVRVNALVSGTTVLNGQGLSNGGLLYQFWREPLRRLVLDTDLQDTEASILKPIIPDIADLIDRTVPDASALEETGQKRLIDTIVQTFANAEQPLLLILEDLQWSQESLDVLKSLIPIAKTNKLLIVGSFSSDERPDLYEELPAMEYMHLGRLEHDAIEDLSISMLGESGRSQEIVDFLYEETEGNVFFLVETLRALAEEAGHLDFITDMTLPDKIFAGGIQQVIARRLNKVSASLKVPLSLSAIAGRYIDIPIISSIYPELDIDAWLTECSAASVLEVIEDKWRFTHEKIRDTLINELDHIERTQAHYQIAQKFETHYANVPDYASLICDHYEEADALENAAKWYIPAANYAKSVYLAASAITYFKKMIDYWEIHGLNEWFTLADQMKAYAGLGKMYFWQASFDDAIATYEDLAHLAEAHSEYGEKAESLARIGLAHIFKGNLGKSLEYVAEADKFANQIDNRLQLTASLWVKGIAGYMQGEFDKALDAGQHLMEIAEEFDSKQHMLQALYILGGVNYAQGKYVQAANCFSRQYEISTHIGDQGPAMDALNNLGQVAEARGDYYTAYESYQEALAQIRKSGVRQPEMLFMSNLGGVQVRREAYAEAINTLEKVLQMAQDQSFSQLSETYRFLAEAFLGLESYASAYPAALEAMQLAQEVNSPDMIGGAYCVLGKVASLGQYQIELPNEDNRLSAEDCFAKSETIFSENGMIGNQARVLRDWSQHERRQSNTEHADKLRAKALELFKQSGADLEVSRMEEES